MIKQNLFQLFQVIFINFFHDQFMLLSKLCETLEKFREK